MKSKIYFSDTDETFDPNIAKGEICPKWMKKELYSEYNCIQRLIINTARINYEKTKFN